MCEFSTKKDLDFYGKIKLINFLRTNPKTVISSLNKESFTSDEFLQPSLEDDGLLIDLDDDEEEGEGGLETDGVDSLRKRLAEMEVQFEKYKEEVAKNFLRDAEKREPTASSSSTKSKGQTSSDKEEGEERDDDTDYFQSYSGNGAIITISKVNISSSS